MGIEEYRRSTGCTIADSPDDMGQVCYYALKNIREAIEFVVRSINVSPDWERTTALCGDLLKLVEAQRFIESQVEQVSAPARNPE